MASPHDTEARYSTKRSVTWVGYQVHLTETCDAERPNRITHVETAVATEGDPVAVSQVHQAFAARDLLPKDHLVDTAYGSGETRLTSQVEYGVDLVCPVPPDNSWQAQEAEAFPLTQFTSDWEAERVICPQGKVSHLWLPDAVHAASPPFRCSFGGRSVGPVRCDPAVRAGKLTRVNSPCTPKRCIWPSFPRGTDSRRQTSSSAMRLRAGVEGTMSPSAYALDLRRSRYIGLARTHLQHLLTASAINLMRAVAWLEEVPRAKTRRSHFAALAAWPTIRQRHLKSRLPPN